MKIRFLNGKQQGGELELNFPSVTIGRDPSNMVVLDSNGVSRCHAELKQQPDGSWIICDLNSTNGIKIGGVRIDNSAPVTDGEKFEIGENLLQVTELKSEPAPVIFNPIITAPLAAETDNGTGAGSLPTKEESLFEKPAPSGRVTVRLEDLPEPAAPPAVDSGSSGAKSKTDTIAEELKKISGPLFGKKDKRGAGGFFGIGAVSDGSGGEEQSSDAEKKKRRSNLIFYTVLTCVVIMILSSAFSIMTPKKKAAGKVPSRQPLVVRYEKEVIGRDNVFRFEFYLKSKFVEAEPDMGTGNSPKNGKPRKRRVYFAEFTIDDLNSRRHYSKETPISDETVEQLRNAIHGSGIYVATPAKVPKDREQNRSLLIVEGARICRVDVPGEFAAPEFNTVEEALIAVAEGFGLKTIALTPEQLLSQAKDYFLKAEDLFSNRAKISNLRDAIIRYRAVVESLEQFSPKPPMWDRARKQLETAEKERDARLELLNAEFKRLSQMGEFAPMRQVFLQQMELTEPESREYANAKRRLVIIDQALRKSKRK